MDNLIPTRKTSFDEFCQIASQRLNVDKTLLAPEAQWVKDVGITSVDIVKISLLLRQKFGIKVSTPQIAMIKTVRDVYQLVNPEVNNE